MPVKPGHSERSIRFFNKMHCKYKLYKWINNFHDVREPYLARLGPSGLFSVPASTVRTSGASIKLG